MKQLINDLGITFICCCWNLPSADDPSVASSWLGSPRVGAHRWFLLAFLTFQHFSTSSSWGRGGRAVTAKRGVSLCCRPLGLRLLWQEQHFYSCTSSGGSDEHSEGSVLHRFCLLGVFFFFSLLLLCLLCSEVQLCLLDVSLASRPARRSRRWLHEDLRGCRLYTVAMWPLARS